ncbi:hypothetical protein F5X96DRAFT_380837 [Biscogniauxia mediterranea]|nr:hypothetical protein F5X96DRAFT_380837 [Biscogniauxia mediterranea]
MSYSVLFPVLFAIIVFKRSSKTFHESFFFFFFSLPLSLSILPESSHTSVTSTACRTIVTSSTRQGHEIEQKITAPSQASPFLDKVHAYLNSSLPRASPLSCQACHTTSYPSRLLPPSSRYLFCHSEPPQIQKRHTHTHIPVSAYKHTYLSYVRSPPHVCVHHRLALLSQCV